MTGGSASVDGDALAWPPIQKSEPTANANVAAIDAELVLFLDLEPDADADGFHIARACGLAAGSSQPRLGLSRAGAAGPGRSAGQRLLRRAPSPFRSGHLAGPSCGR